MRRILCLISRLDTGGAETFLMKIYRALPKDIKLDFVVSTNTGYYENEVTNLGGKIYRVPLRTKNPIAVYRAIKKIVKQNKYKYVLKLCDTPIGVFDLWAAKAGGADILCVRSCNAQSEEGCVRAFLYSILRPIFNKLSTKKIAPSLLAAKYTFGDKIVNAGKVNLLNNGIDTSVYRFNENDRNRIRKEFSIEEKYVIGHIGRFSTQKNHQFLIEIFSEIIKKRPDTVLMLIGNGEKKEAIKELVSQYNLSGKVIFCGIRSDIPALLSAMDTFLFPSFYEGMPNTVIEAQSSGLPCIISDTITREAAITDNVFYLSIQDKASVWADTVLSKKAENRTKAYKKVLDAGYGIGNVVEEFEKIIFESE